ncbi:MAG: metallophosphoesterase family protein [Candidatus Hodarchaeales archaeon]
MSKILFVSDIHLGIKYSYLVDLQTGLSRRTLDFVYALERVVQYAIDNHIDIFVICGDLFDRITVGPTLLRIVRDRIWKPLIKSQIPVILIGGNHDTPQNLKKGTPFGELNLIPDWTVARTPKSYTIKAKNTDEEVGFILLPYMTATQAVVYAEDLVGHEIEKENHMAEAQLLLKKWIESQVRNLKTKTKIIVGHSYVQGSAIGVIPYPDQLPHEFQFNKKMLPLEEINLAVFGHIHTHQELYNRKVIVPGSLERVDFGEVNEDKGFYVYDTDTDSIEFHSNNPRKLLKYTIIVSDQVNNPTEFIVNNLPQPEILDEGILRLEVIVSEMNKKNIRLKELGEYLDKNTFHYDIIWDTSIQQKETKVLSELLLDPLSLFQEFVKEKYNDYPLLKDLREKGQEILEEALATVEEKQ